MPDVEVKDILEHFGVKGQHWGIRNKVRGQQGSVNKFNAQAERRPSRGNFRKAGRAQIQLDSRMKKKERGRNLVTRVLLGSHGYKSVKELPASDRDIYSVQRSLGLKTIPDPTGSHERYHQKVKADVRAHEKALKKEKFNPKDTPPYTGRKILF